MEQLPADISASFLLAFLVSRVVGIGGSLQASWMRGGREEGENEALPPFPSPPKTHVSLLLGSLRCLEGA